MIWEKKHKIREYETESEYDGLVSKCNLKTLKNDGFKLNVFKNWGGILRLKGKRLDFHAACDFNSSVSTSDTDWNSNCYQEEFYYVWG